MSRPFFRNLAFAVLALGAALTPAVGRGAQAGAAGSPGTFWRATMYYVAPDAPDDAPGTAAKPCSLKDAIARLRNVGLDAKPNSNAEHCEILLADGTYYLSEPLSPRGIFPFIESVHIRPRAAASIEISADIARALRSLNTKNPSAKIPVPAALSIWRAQTSHTLHSKLKK